MIVICVILGIYAVKQIYAANEETMSVDKDEFKTWSEMSNSFQFNLKDEYKKIKTNDKSSYHYKNGLYCIDKNTSTGSGEYKPSKRVGF